MGSTKYLAWAMPFLGGRCWMFWKIECFAFYCVNVIVGVRFWQEWQKQFRQSWENKTNCTTQQILQILSNSSKIGSTKYFASPMPLLGEPWKCSEKLNVLPIFGHFPEIIQDFLCTNSDNDVICSRKKSRGISFPLLLFLWLGSIPRSCICWRTLFNLAGPLY